MKYKVGDVVRVKSLAWYNENKKDNGCILCPSEVFTPSMSQYCGKRVLITQVFHNHYHIDCSDASIISFNWTDEMFEEDEEFANYKNQEDVPRIVVSGDMMVIVPEIGYKIIEVCGRFYVMRI